MIGVSSDVTITASKPGHPFGDVAATLRAALSSRLERQRVYRQTLRELQAYSRTDLLDMGIDPDAIHSLAREAARAAKVTGAGR